MRDLREKSGNRLILLSTVISDAEVRGARLNRFPASRALVGWNATRYRDELMTSDVGKERSDSPGESALVAEAIAGDSVALERLLFAHYDKLERRIGSKLPARLQATHAVED